jgi:hypothetical protein
MPASKRPHQRRQHVMGRAGREPHAQTPDLAVAQPPCGGREVVRGAQHRSGFLEEQLAIRGQAHRATGSDEQPHAECALQVLDPFGQGRLRDMQPGRGAREMQIFGERRK